MVRSRSAQRVNNAANFKVVSLVMITMILENENLTSAGRASGMNGQTRSYRGPDEWPVAPPPRPTPLKPPAPPCPPGVRRVECAAAVFDAPPEKVPTAYISDAPFLGNGNLGAIVGLDKGTSALSFWLGNNNFWSTNTAPDHGLCDSAASSVNPLHADNAYTLLSSGSLSIKPTNSDIDNSFQAVMDIETGLLHANVTSNGTLISTTSFVSTDQDLLAIRLDTNETIALNVEVAVPKAADAVSGRSPWVLPTEAGIRGSSIYAGRQGVMHSDNNVLLNTCGRGGQHRHSQEFSVAASGQITLWDGRCLLLAETPDGPDCTNSTRRITIGPCVSKLSISGWQLKDGNIQIMDESGTTLYANPDARPPPQLDGYSAFPGDVGGQSKGGKPLCNCTSIVSCPMEAAAQCNASSSCVAFAVYSEGPRAGWNGWCQLYDATDAAAKYADQGWNLWQKRILINHAGQERLGSGSTPYVVAQLTPPTEKWEFNEVTKYLSFGNTSCLTSVEPNRNLNSAVSLVVSSSNSRSSTGTMQSTNNDYAANLTLELIAGVPQWLIVAVEVCCNGCDAIGTRRCPLADSGKNAAVDNAIVRANNSSKSVDEELKTTSAWWDRYWNASSINLGPQYRLLEQYYYGMQYTVGAASRPGKMAPGLWGPWLSADGAGWNGDYTINYNFQAIYYAVFSENRPDLALTYFPMIEQMVDLGKWRTQMDWSVPGAVGLPGAFSNMFIGWPDADGRHETPRGFINGSGINFPGHFSPFPEIYFPNDMGQRSDAVFAGMHFIKYFDATQNITFLRDRAYPYLKLVADFYEGYIVKNNVTGRLDILDSCAMEECGAQGLVKGQSSNNPPFDLGPAKTLFRKLAKYSEMLGEDADRRSTWMSLPEQLADFPTTIDPSTNRMVLNQQEATGVFPSKSNYGNARYPIVFFASMHPGDALSLSDDPTLVQAARDTVDAVNSLNWWSPTNGLCMAWPPAARVSNNASATLANFQAAVNLTIQQNLWPWIVNRPSGGSGCPVENAGANLAINDLLMQSHEGFIRLFPAGWAVGQPVSFTTLRADGAFLVSASSEGSGIASNPIVIDSLAGVNCTIALPHGWNRVVVRQRLEHQLLPVPVSALPLNPSKDTPTLYTFVTLMNGSYEVTQT